MPPDESQDLNRFNAHGMLKAKSNPWRNYMNDLTALITILGVFIANAAIVIPLFLWSRAEARADALQTEAKLESTRELVKTIQNEIKNFHNRLCEIEAKK